MLSSSGISSTIAVKDKIFFHLYANFGILAWCWSLFPCSHNLSVTVPQITDGHNKVVSKQGGMFPLVYLFLFKIFFFKGPWKTFLCVLQTMIDHMPHLSFRGGWDRGRQTASKELRMGIWKSWVSVIGLTLPVVILYHCLISQVMIYNNCLMSDIKCWALFSVLFLLIVNSPSRQVVAFLFTDEESGVWVTWILSIQRC